MSSNHNADTNRLSFPDGPNFSKTPIVHRITTELISHLDEPGTGNVEGALVIEIMTDVL